MNIFSSSWVCLSCGTNQWVIFPCPCLNPWTFHYIFSPLSRWRGEWQSGFGEHWCPAKDKPHQVVREGVLPNKFQLFISQSVILFCIFALSIFLPFRALQIHLTQDFKVILYLLGTEWYIGGKTNKEQNWLNVIEGKKPAQCPIIYLLRDWKYQPDCWSKSKGCSPIYFQWTSTGKWGFDIVKKIQKFPGYTSS